MSRKACFLCLTATSILGPRILIAQPRASVINTEMSGGVYKSSPHAVNPAILQHHTHWQVDEMPTIQASGILSSK